MSIKCRALNFLQEKPDQLPLLLQNAWAQRDSESILSLARRPKKRWTKDLSFATALILSSAPQHEMILWIPVDYNLDLPQSAKAEMSYLLDEYSNLFVQLNGTEIELYMSKVRKHISDQESSLWLQLSEPPELSRALRELSYEHRGLEKGLDSLAEALDRARLGTLTSREREKIDLDFYHLLEHHLEREAQALYPAASLLLGGYKNF